MANQNNTPIYTEQGGKKLIVGSGGELEVTGTGILNVNGGVIKRNGVDVTAQQVLSACVTATIAEVNAGKTLIAGITGKQIRIVGGYLISHGIFAALTAIEIQESDGTPVVASYAQAQLTDGSAWDMRQGATGQTIGAGFNALLTAGNGVKVVKTGSTATGGTSVDIILDYVIV